MSYNIVQRFHKDFFNKYGYVILQNQLTYKTKQLLKHSLFNIEFDSLNKQHKHIHHFELDSNNHKVLSRSEYFAHNNPLMRKFFDHENDTNLPIILKNLTDESYHLYKEKINYKYPNTGAYKAHQDITAYPNTSNHITCLIPLCNTYKMNGSIQFSPLISNNIEDNHILDHDNGVILDENLLNWQEPISANFGDIILFNSFTPHKSPVNTSSLSRKSLYLTFNNSKEGFKRNEYYDIKKKNQENIDKLSLIDHYDGTIITNKTNNNEHRKYIIDNILNLYKTKGNTFYDKNITQSVHAFATLRQSIQNGNSQYFQLSCFLHDIGHLLLNEHDKNIEFLDTNQNHELIAYNFLKQYFPDKITKPILLHVQAKRYLCSQFKPYYDKLSENSKKSFTLQGGLMTPYHIKNFEKNRYFNEAIKLREYEDISKKSSKNHIIVDYDYIEKLLYKFIQI